jgi:uncharacterized protein (TIGR02271 family)
LANEEQHGDRSTEGEYSLEGYQAYDVHYEKIGKVDDLLVDDDDRPKYVGVKTGLLGTRTTLIPIELVRVNDKRKLIEIEAGNNTVKEGPTFGDDREITSEFEQRALSYYRAEIQQVSSTKREADVTHYPDASGGERVDLRPGERLTETREHSSEDSLRAPRSGTDRESGAEYGSEDELRVQRAEEELRADTRKREAGGVRVRKQVRTDRARVVVPKKRQEVRVERVPIEEGVPPEPETGDEEIRIPVIEEEIVIEKRPVVKEEIRLRKEVVEDEEVVEEDVRKEEVDIDDQTERRNG